MVAPVKLRIYAGIFAAMLGLLSAWILAPELVRRPLGYFPPDQRMAAQDKAAPIAARIGWLRGDLWVDYALTADAGLFDQSTPGSGGLGKSARSITEDAARVAPYDSRAWLLLSAIGAQSGWDNKAAAALKMSFYTSPEDARIIPFRLRLAFRSEALSDDELQQLLAQQIRTIVLQKPALKLALFTAYGDASPPAQEFIEGKLREIDPKVLAEMRAANGH